MVVGREGGREIISKHRYQRTGVEEGRGVCTEHTSHVPRCTGSARRAIQSSTSSE